MAELAGAAELLAGGAIEAFSAGEAEDSVAAADFRTGVAEAWANGPTEAAGAGAAEAFAITGDAELTATGSEPMLDAGEAAGAIDAAGCPRVKPGTGVPPGAAAT